jgi:hypothetical protein
VFHQPDDRFGGQKLGELQITLAKEIPSVNNSELFWDAIDIWNDQQYFTYQFKEMISKKISIEEGLKRTQDAVLKRMKEKPNP